MSFFDDLETRSADQRASDLGFGPACTNRKCSEIERVCRCAGCG
jgi:hypothetical protein